ncbi:MAG: hypothetical protein WAL53_05130, partial [Nitrososphaeraceae archaeon]
SYIASKKLLLNGIRCFASKCPKSTEIFFSLFFVKIFYRHTRKNLMRELPSYWKQKKIVSLPCPHPSSKNFLTP